MEYVVGNRHYIYVEFFVPDEYGGDYVYTNKLKYAKKFKTLEKAQSVARPGGLDVWEYMVDENGCTHLSKA